MIIAINWKEALIFFRLLLSNCLKSLNWKKCTGMITLHIHNLIIQCTVNRMILWVGLSCILYRFYQVPLLNTLRIFSVLSDSFSYCSGQKMSVLVVKESRYVVVIVGVVKIWPGARFSKLPVKLFCFPF